MPSETLYAIHGNLQTPAVWKKFRGMINGSNGRPLTWHTEDLWSAHVQQLAAAAQHTRINAFRTWAADFCMRVASESHLPVQGQPRLDKPATRAAAAASPRPWLLGYSLGGRLALHALVQNPSLWRGAIIVGADSGLSAANARRERLSHDQRWGQRFRDEPWQGLLAEWDAQSVFGKRPNPLPLRESDFDRASIAQLFNAFSKGRQDDLLPELAELNAPPVLFLAGADDPIYATVGEKLAQACPAFTFRAVPGAAHRVPWEAPAAFTRAVQEFIGGGRQPTLLA